MKKPKVVNGNMDWIKGNNEDLLILLKQVKRVCIDTCLGEFIDVSKISVEKLANRLGADKAIEMSVSNYTLYICKEF